MEPKPLNEAPWTQTPPIHSFDDRAHCETINGVFHPDRLDSTHPIAIAWNTPSPKSRKLLHQLAEDARLLREVPGFGDLCRKIRTDIPAFANYAYELRVAGSLARGPNQQVVHLGGSKAGPDIVFRADSGHECGVACYRALSATRDIRDVQRLIDAVAQRFRRVHCGIDPDNYFLRLIFPEFPMRWPIDQTAAMVVLGHLWTQRESPRYVFDGVEGTRHLLPRDALERGDKQRIRVRLEFPVSAWDQRRVLGAASNKMDFEAGQWARGYAGVPLMAIEESDGAHGGTLQSDLRGIMREPNVFAGILLTHYPANGLENVVWLPRQTESLGLHVQVQTMWETVQTFAGNRPLLTLSSGTAFVDLDFRKRGRTLEFKTGPFHSEWHSARLPFMGDIQQFVNHPQYPQVMARAMTFLRDQQARLGPRGPNEVIDIEWDLEPSSGGV